MAYSDLIPEEKLASEQIVRDIRAWAGMLQKLLNDAKALRLSYDQTLIPIFNARGVQGADVMPNTASLSGSDPGWNYTDTITLAGYMDGDANSITGNSGGDWDEAAKLQLLVQAAGPDVG